MVVLVSVYSVATIPSTILLQMKINLRSISVVLDQSVILLKIISFQQSVSLESIYWSPWVHI